MNNVLRKRLIIRKMKRRIKRASKKFFKIEDLRIDRSEFRASVVYDCPRLLENMKKNGWSSGKAILVNVNKDADGTVHIRQLPPRPNIGNDILDLWKSHVPK